MRKSNLTDYQRKRFIQNGCKCSICNEPIYDCENLIIIKKKFGKMYKYEFLHQKCRCDNEEGKEKKK